MLSGTANNISIGGVTLTFPQAIELTEAYEEFGGVATHRTITGAAVRQKAWTKKKITLSGVGALPPGLAAVDWTVPQEVVSSQFGTFTAFIAPPQQSHNKLEGKTTWSIVAEEV